MQELEKILEEIEDHVKKFVVYGTSYDYISFRWVKQIIRKHMNDGWIPVEERPPKTNGTYNVTRYIDGHFISDSAYFDGQNTWHSDNRVNHSRPYLTDVIAWRPLPEPYYLESETEKPDWRQDMLRKFDRRE